jgi:hypothetical protein
MTPAHRARHVSCHSQIHNQYATYVTPESIPRDASFTAALELTTTSPAASASGCEHGQVAFSASHCLHISRWPSRAGVKPLSEWRDTWERCGVVVSRCPQGAPGQIARPSGTGRGARPALCRVRRWPASRRAERVRCLAWWSDLASGVCGRRAADRGRGCGCRGHLWHRYLLRTRTAPGRCCSAPPESAAAGDRGDARASTHREPGPVMSRTRRSPGRELVAELARRGSKVRALSRNPAAAGVTPCPVPRSRCVPRPRVRP